jgi:hypothetical protein
VPVEEQWGVRILLFGFSNISPSPTTLEITQLELLARERLNLYEHLRDNGLSDEAAVALIAGAVVAMPTDRTPQTRSGLRAEEARIQREVEQAAKDATAQEKLNPKLEPPEPPTPPGE